MPPASACSPSRRGRPALDLLRAGGTAWHASSAPTAATLGEVLGVRTVQCGSATAPQRHAGAAAPGVVTARLYTAAAATASSASSARSVRSAARRSTSTLSAGASRSSAASCRRLDQLLSSRRWRICWRAATAARASLASDAAGPARQMRSDGSPPALPHLAPPTLLWRSDPARRRPCHWIARFEQGVLGPPHADALPSGNLEQRLTPLAHRGSFARDPGRFRARVVASSSISRSVAWPSDPPLPGRR